MSKYDEDLAESCINNNKLKNLFNISDLNEDSFKKADEIVNDLVNETKEIKNESKNPDSIIYDTIDRANRLLDKIEEEIETGGTARMFEVAGGLINAVTAAANSIMGTEQKDSELLLKERALELKERETAVKEAIGQKKINSDSTINNNILVTDRESLLKIIQNREDE